MIKVREVIKLIEKDGLVTISGNLREDVARGTFNSILKQAGLKEVKEDV